MSDTVQRALDAIAAAERDIPDRVEITPEYARHIAQVTALPENQSGADKSWLWPEYEYVRRHFLDARPVRT